MAFVAARVTVFSLDDSGGVLRNLSAFLDKASLKRIATLLETTTFGATTVRRQAVGLLDGNIPISGKWDPTATTGPDEVLSGLLGAANSSTYEYGPQGSTGGFVKYTGECRLSAYDTDSSVEGLTTFTGQLDFDGACTRTTY